MEYYDEVVEMEDVPGIKKPTIESGIIGKSLPDDMELNRLTVKIGRIVQSEMISICISGNSKIVIQESGRQSRRPTSSVSRNRQPQKNDSFASDSDDSDTDQQDSKQFITDHKEWEVLDVPMDVKEIFQYILR